MIRRGPGAGSVMVTQLLNCLGVGGTERQLVEHLRNLDKSRFRADVLVHHKVGEFLPVVRGLGYEPQEFSLNGSLLRPGTALTVRSIVKRMQRTNTQLVHCHDFYSNIIGSMAARTAGLPYIISRRDMGAWLNWPRKQLLRAATMAAPHVLVNAYAVRDQLVNEEGIPSSRITVIHNGLDLERFDKEATQPLTQPIPAMEGHSPLIVMVGNMKHGVKGHPELIMAAAAVLRIVPECRFLLVGDGELRKTFEQQAQELGIAHAMIFAGRRTDIPALLTRCHVAVCASHSEGLSNAVMESMAARLPVIATGVGGNVELVRDGRTGFIVRKQDPTGLAQRLLEVVRDLRRAKQMGQAGRRRIQDEFSTAQLSQRTANLYSDILGLKQEIRRAA